MKVFVYDVLALELIYRIIVFVGVGLLLLASAYLYRRYSKTIGGFLMGKLSPLVKGEAYFHHNYTFQQERLTGSQTGEWGLIPLAAS